jgi:hypothetical protein
MSRLIDIEALLKNYKEMINTLEYDSMRSAGKAKINAQTLMDMHALVERYEQKLNSQRSAPKKEAS